MIIIDRYFTPVLTAILIFQRIWFHSRKIKHWRLVYALLGKKNGPESQNSKLLMVLITNHRSENEKEVKKKKKKESRTLNRHLLACARGWKWAGNFLLEIYLHSRPVCKEEIRKLSRLEGFSKYLLFKAINTERKHWFLLVQKSCQQVYSQDILGKSYSTLNYLQF